MSPLRSSIFASSSAARALLGSMFLRDDTSGSRAGTADSEGVGERRS